MFEFEKFFFYGLSVVWVDLVKLFNVFVGFILGVFGVVGDEFVYCILELLGGFGEWNNVSGSYYFVGWEVVVVVNVEDYFVIGLFDEFDIENGVYVFVILVGFIGVVVWVVVVVLGGLFLVLSKVVYYIGCVEFVVVVEVWFVIFNFSVGFSSFVGVSGNLCVCG